MRFLNPAAFLFALLVPLVVLLYLLKLKRREVIVSAVLLWRRSIEDLTANAPFQKLRRNLLLLLQILFILLVVFLLARPYLRAGATTGISYIVLIDASASMQATDMDGRSRLEAARDLAVQLVDGMKPGDRMMIMSFAKGTEVVENWTPDGETLRAALQRIEASDLSTDLSEALNIALTLSRTEPNCSIRVLSDGAFPDLPEIQVDEEQEIRFMSVGVTGENIGITRVGAARVSEEYHGYDVLAGVQNFAGESRRVVVEFWRGDELLDAKEVALEPLGWSDAVFSGLSGVEGVVELRLSPAAGEDEVDVFPADDRAWTVIPERRAAETLLVSAGNPVLENVLAVDPCLRVTRVPPESFDGSVPVDLVVFDAFGPPTLRPGRYLFFGVTPPVADIVGAGTESSPIVVDWDRTHPLNRFVSYDNVRIEEALRIELLDPTESLVESSGGPLLAAFERDGGVRGVYVGFDVLRSDWPLRFSFPVFVGNAANWLLGGNVARGEHQFHTGEAIPIETEQAGGRVRVVDVIGESHVIELGPEETVAYFARTDRAGIYTARSGSGEIMRYAVNLASPEESDIRPRGNLDVGNSRIAASDEPLRHNVEIWKPLAIAGLFLLGLEWWVYTRKVWI